MLSLSLAFTVRNGFRRAGVDLERFADLVLVPQGVVEDHRDRRVADDDDRREPIVAVVPRLLVIRHHHRRSAEHCAALDFGEVEYDGFMIPHAFGP